MILPPLFFSLFRKVQHSCSIRNTNTATATISSTSISISNTTTATATISSTSISISNISSGGTNDQHSCVSAGPSGSEKWSKLLKGKPIVPGKGKKGASWGATELAALLRAMGLFTQAESNSLDVEAMTKIASENLETYFVSAAKSPPAFSAAHRASGGLPPLAE